MHVSLTGTSPVLFFVLWCVSISRRLRRADVESVRMLGLNFMSLWRPLAVFLFALLPAIAVGHPGHGSSNDPESILHYLTSAIHVIPVASMLFAGLTVLRGF